MRNTQTGQAGWVASPPPYLLNRDHWAACVRLGCAWGTYVCPWPCRFRVRLMCVTGVSVLLLAGKRVGLWPRRRGSSWAAIIGIWVIMGLVCLVLLCARRAKRVGQVQPPNSLRV